MLKKLFSSAPARSLSRLPSNLEDVINIGTPRAVALWLANTDHDARDEQLGEVTSSQADTLADLLTPESARELLESVSPHTALGFLRRMPIPVAAGLLDSLESDDATRIIDLMNDDESRRILRAMEFSHSALVRGLLSWPEDSAASRMRPEFLRVGPEATIQDAVDVSREDPDGLEEGVFVTSETENGQVALGWLSPDAMVLGRRHHPVTTQMVSASRLQQWSVTPLADQETVTHRVRAFDSEVIPVMDGVYILGVITHDTITDILLEEAREDAEKQGGSAPLEVPYLQASPWVLWSKRVGWLLILFIAAMYTGTVMRAFEDELETVVALSFFIPLLIGTGGNVATQITTTLIRSMGQDEVQMRDLGRVVWKEARTSVLLGLTMAVAGAVRAWTLGVENEVVLTVTLSLLAIVLWSSLIAAGLPLILKWTGVDPAVVSGPMIATIVDGTGLLIYFSIAKWVIPGL